MNGLDTGDEPRLVSYAAFISDMHLGKKHARPDMLFEFLSRLDCEKLYIVGDGIEGWGMMKGKHRKFDEMTQRVFDALNAHAANGTEIIFIPGNHDERLRADWDNQAMKFKKNKPHKASLFRRSILDQDHTFVDRQTGRSATYHLTNEAVYTAPDDRRYKVVHGDQYDPQYLQGNSGRLLSQFGDAAYDTMISVNGALSYLSRRTIGRDLSISKALKAAAKNYFDVTESFQRELTRIAEEEPDIDGLICGHIHTPMIADEQTPIYINTGDWVESCTAVLNDFDGKWHSVDWPEDRAALGFSAFANAQDPNPFAEYRGVSQAQFKWIQRIFPAEDFHKRQDALRAIRRQANALNTKFHEAAEAQGALAGLEISRIQRALAHTEKKLETAEEALALH